MAAMNTAERLPLSRDRIIAVAIHLVDEHGLNGLSMRKLGSALGVEAMSLYNHIENKDDVLDGMCDAVMCEVGVPPRDGPWTERLRALAIDVRRVGLEHPEVMAMLGSRSSLTPGGFEPVWALHQTLIDAGFGSERGMHAFVFVAAFVLGYLRLDRGRMDMTHSASGIPHNVWTGSAVQPAARLGAELVALDWDVEFERCLDMVIESLVALIGSAPMEVD